VADPVRNGAFPVYRWESVQLTYDGAFAQGVEEPETEVSCTIIWVAKTGNDTTGTGSQTAPYLTIERALEDFGDGCQIRVLDGLYTPPDTLIFDSLTGSLFAEHPNGVEIQPVTTTTNGACISITSSDRFRIQGVKILQSPDTANNLVGIYANEVSNLLCYNCAVSDFESTTGSTYGIYAFGSGRVENCLIEDMNALSGALYGIRTDGIDVIDCTVRRLSGGASCSIFGIQSTDVDNYTV
jgi:hypothetical protein